MVKWGNAFRLLIERITFTEFLFVQLPSGEIDLPPIVLGTLGTDPGKKTVCIYGHLDVQPAAVEDGWDTEPFKLEEIDGEMVQKFFGFCWILRLFDLIQKAELLHWVLVTGMLFWQKMTLT